VNGHKRRIPWWLQIGFKFASSRAGGWFYVNLAPHIDRLLMRLSRGRVSTAAGLPTLMLTTIGAKTGQPRSTPLIYLPDGDRVVLVASRGGDTCHPGWYHNLRANPDATLLIGDRSATYRAREASGAEREQLWRKAVAFYPGYAVYQRRSGGRQIPVLVLTPER
jgi:deazaflavin-dependent oxidoreductase (nitroreductase family)